MIIDTIVDEVLVYLRSRQDFGKIVFSAIQGGYARQTADVTSDVDLLIAYSRKSDIYDRELRHLNYGSHRFGLKFVILSELPHAQDMLERVRYIYTNETLFVYGDRDAWQKIVDACKMSPLEQKDILMFCMKRCSRRGIYCNNDSILETLHRKDNNPDVYPPFRSICEIGKKRRDYWIKRQDKISAKLLCWSALEYLIVMIFALNEQFTPSPKYRYYLLQKLPWLPNHIHMLFNGIESDRNMEYWQIHGLFCDILSGCIQYAMESNIDIRDNDNLVALSYLPMFQESAT